MKRFLTFYLILLAYYWTSNAQSLSVESFRLLDTDLTANTAGTMERDQNGNVAALIKVVTTQTGFSFDGGMAGIVRTVQKTGEMWVYVPAGIQKLTISHQQLGMLRDFALPISVEAARTYEMRLASAEIVSNVKYKSTKQFVEFIISPANAMLEVEGEPLEVDNTGHAEKRMDFGTYTYKVSAHDYHPTAGQFVLNNSSHNEKVVVELKPNFGSITFVATESSTGATVYIDGQSAGKIPFTSDRLSSGMHRVKITREHYFMAESVVEVTDGETTTLEPALEPKSAIITISAPEEGTIWIEGEQKGSDHWNGLLDEGRYVVECRKEGHMPSSQEVMVKAGQSQTITLKVPVPVTGAVVLTSKPSESTIILDGKDVGRTPKTIPELLVGEHRVELRHAGYISKTQTIQVEANKENEVTVTLQPDDSIPTKPAVRDDVSREESSRERPANPTALTPATKKSCIARNQFCLGGTAQFLSMMAFGIAADAYIANVNVGIDVMCSCEGSERIWWYRNISSTSFSFVYYPTCILSGRVGYGILVGSHFRFTPQIGLDWTAVKGEPSNYMTQHTWFTAGTLGLRMELAPIRHLTLIVTPELHTPSGFLLPQGEIAERIMPYLPTRWNNVFTLKAGLQLCF